MGELVLIEISIYFEKKTKQNRSAVEELTEDLASRVSDDCGDGDGLSDGNDTLAPRIRLEICVRDTRGGSWPMG